MGGLTVAYDPEITITSSPSTGSGFVDVGYFYSDGDPVVTPFVVSFPPGTLRNITANSIVSCGSACRYIWIGWSDNGNQSHVITTPPVPTSYVAYFKKQYMLNMSTNPNGAGTVAPASGSWWDSGSRVTISANSAIGYGFSSWNGTGSGSYSGVSDPASVTMNGPINETAQFHSLVNITLYQGWNLISLPIVPNSTSITYLLRSQIAKHEVVVVWSYAGSPPTWQTFVPGKGGTLTKMTDGNGYWINMKTSDTLYVDGYVIAPGSSPPTYSLSKGWNLLGFKPQPIVTNETVGAFLSIINGHYDPNNVWVYNNASNNWVRAGLAYSIFPGQAMWILMTAPATLKP